MLAPSTGLGAMSSSQLSIRERHEVDPSSSSFASVVTAMKGTKRSQEHDGTVGLNAPSNLVPLTRVDRHSSSANSSGSVISFGSALVDGVGGSPSFATAAPTGTYGDLKLDSLNIAPVAFSLGGGSPAPSCGVRRVPKFAGVKRPDLRRVVTPVVPTADLEATDSISPGVLSPPEKAARFQNIPTSPSGEPAPPPATEFEALQETHIRPLMDLNDRINALTAKETKINSTRIVVAGDQSHGKTSLLEALCGVNLPRGEGIQTRVPLILQIRQAAPGEDDHAIISVVIDGSRSKPPKPFFGTPPSLKREELIALSEIEDKVREYTDLAAGPGKNIVDTPIQLAIFRRADAEGGSKSTQDNLTLVDLPGITRVALDDQAGGDGKLLEQQIMTMCRRYMEPKESILLNVVSSMVDFSTSASLQLSRELDKERRRTLLCITKVDQHAERGLHHKIQTSIQTMQLNPRHVFAVRNRSQQENQDALPLPQVRELELVDLEKLTEGHAVEYQLGVYALSKWLVKTQCEEILQTLPKTQLAIEQVTDQLERQLQELGERVGDASSCRAKAIQLIDACTSRLRDEARGQVSSELASGDSSGEGETVELMMTVPDFAAAYQDGDSITKNSEKRQIGRFSFYISTKKITDYVCVSLHINCEDHSMDAFEGTMDLLFELVASMGNSVVKSWRCKLQNVNAKEATQSWKGFLADLAVSLKGEVTITAHVYIEKIDPLESTRAELFPRSLFCSRLANLQDGFTSDLDKLYSNAYFFSEAFRKGLARELEGSRGGYGMPGMVAPHVAIGMLQKLRTKLSEPLSTYRRKVFEECNDTSRTMIEHYVQISQHPKLQALFLDCVLGIFKKQLVELEHYHSRILEWEETICSNNHYFMDTVNSIKAQVYDSDLSNQKDKPLYLQGLDPKTIKAMSNEDQKLVDMQIEIFAYWKLMKKRLVDYVILSTNSELVHRPIDKMLKPSLMDAVFRHDHLVHLFSPDPGVELLRASVSSRLDKLQEALHDIIEYKTKHPGGWLEIQ
jgi:GTPase SAR1 family protein